MDPKKVERGCRQIGARTWLRTLDDRLGLSHDEKARKDRARPAALPAVERLLDDKPEHIIPRTDTASDAGGQRLGLPARGAGAQSTIAASSTTWPSARGTLTAEERYIINHHIVQTIIMLSQLPFPSHLKTVPAIAGGHHEKMDGTGYPKRLKARGNAVDCADDGYRRHLRGAHCRRPPVQRRARRSPKRSRSWSFMKRDQHIDPELVRAVPDLGRLPELRRTVSCVPNRSTKWISLST